MNPKSPFNHNTRLVSTFKTEDVIEKYKSTLNLDVQKYFNDIAEFGLYECIKSGYKFFFPSQLSGDDKFYECLQEFSWYYMPWKWEHQRALEQIGKSDFILEVGSGGLGFLKKLDALGYNITGLELNQSKVEEAKLENLKVLGESIEVHSDKHIEAYDFVCSFQVLEHVSDVHSFIDSMLKVLKKNGKLLISVPNNESFIRHSQGGILNLPPHHMGWWTIKAFKYIEDNYNLKLRNTYYEPLQDYHVSWYVNSKIDVWFPDGGMLKRIFLRLRLNLVFKFLVILFKSKIRGHSFVVVFEKI